MEPLARVRHQATTGRSGQRGVVPELITQPLKSFATANRQRHRRSLTELLPKKLMKTLLTSLHIGTVTLHLDP